MDSTVTASDRRVNEFVRKYAGTFTLDLGITELEVHVLAYLYDNRVYGATKAHSSYDTFKALQSIQAANSVGSSFNGRGKKITEKKVAQSLRNLVAMEFVKIVPVGKKGKGRPPKLLYELKSSMELNRLIISRIEERRNSLLKVFNELSDAEEQKGMRELDAKNK